MLNSTSQYHTITLPLLNITILNFARTKQYTTKPYNYPTILHNTRLNNNITVAKHNCTWPYHYQTVLYPTPQLLYLRKTQLDIAITIPHFTARYNYFAVTKHNQTPPRQHQTVPHKAIHRQRFNSTLHYFSLHIQNNTVPNSYITSPCPAKTVLDVSKHYPTSATQNETLPDTTTHLQYKTLPYSHDYTIPMQSKNYIIN